jgi:hypothetical protein
VLKKCREIILTLNHAFALVIVANNHETSTMDLLATETQQRLNLTRVASQRLVRGWPVGGGGIVRERS